MTLATLPYEFLDKHPVLTIEGRKYLMDTGCPVSFGVVPALSIGTRRFPILGPEGIQGFDIEAVRRLVSTVDGLVGMDVLAPFCWVLDAVQGRAMVSSKSPGLPVKGVTQARVSHQSTLDNRPVLTVHYDGRAERALFDTGAWLSYRVAKRPPAEAAEGLVEDYNPQLGPFTTPVWKTQLALEGKAFPVQFGELPPEGRIPLEQMRIDWVIGFDILSAFPLMTLDFPAMRLLIHTGV
jgi:hypothetical protein